MKFVVTKTADQLELQALHRVRERLPAHRKTSQHFDVDLPCSRREYGRAGGGTVKKISAAAGIGAAAIARRVSLPIISKACA